MDSAPSKPLERIKCLTTGQLDCLRLVSLHYSSKDIGRRLSISSHTVDSRIRDVLRTLNVANRAQAARMYDDYIKSCPSEADALVDYQRLIYQSPRLSFPRESRKTNVTHRSVDRRGAEVADFAHESEGTSFGRGEESGFRWSVLAGVDRDNDLSAFVRVLVILTCAMAAIAGFALLVNVAEGLSRLR